MTTTARFTGRRSRGLVEQLFHDHAVAPLAVELAVAPVHADHAEAAALVQAETRRVLGEDAREDLPEAALGVDAAERLQRGAAGPGAARGARDVDRVLGHAGIGRPAAVGARGRPGHHAAVALDDHRREALALVRELRGDLGGRARLGLEGGDAIGDALVVDGRDRRRVLGPRQPRRERAHGRDTGTSQRNSQVAAAAPASCATTKPGTSAGRMPANVSLAARASVTAGFANEVDAVNQYAAMMYAATVTGTAAALRRAQPQMTASSPNVATNSLNIWAPPARTRWEAKKSGSENITWAAATPTKAPAICAATYGGTSRHASPPCEAAASVTAGLKWAPDTGPNVAMRATRAAPVATVLASSAIATLPPARRTPMIPDPMTAARRKAVPSASAVIRQARLEGGIVSAISRDPARGRARSAVASRCDRAPCGRRRAAPPRCRWPPTDPRSSSGSGEPGPGRGGTAPRRGRTPSRRSPTPRPGSRRGSWSCDRAGRCRPRPSRGWRAGARAWPRCRRWPPRSARRPARARSPPPSGCGRSCGCRARARAGASRPWLAGPDERAHELAVDGGCDVLRRQPRPGQRLPRFLGPVDPGRLDRHA